MKIIVVSVTGEETSLDADGGLTVMEVLRSKNYLDGECNGSLACATCHVWVDDLWKDKLQPPVEEEEDMLDVAFHLTKQSRLSCQIKVSSETNGIRVFIPHSKE